MPRLTPADEYFYHQIPEPLPVVANASEHWRESLFFVLHPRSGEGDALVLTLAHYPVREEMDSLQFGRIGGEAVFARHSRPYAGDPHTMAVGPVRVDIVEPFRKVRLFVDAAASPIGLDLTFTARTRECGLRRGTMLAGTETLWDQSHMIQSGWYNGSYTSNGKTVEVRDWWGQRDHSWGNRDWWAFSWSWTAGRFDDGTRFHGTSVDFGDVHLFGTGYVQAPGAPMAATDQAGYTPVLGDHGLPTSCDYRLGDLDMKIRPVAFSPVRLEAPDGRVSLVPRAWTTFTAADGRTGQGWTEWNQPQPT